MGGQFSQTDQEGADQEAGKAIAADGGDPLMEQVEDGTPPLDKNSDQEEDDEQEKEKEGPRPANQSAQQQNDTDNNDKGVVKDNGHDDNEDNEELASSSWHENAVALYICLFATFGEIARVFLGRFFGSDCSKGQSNSAPDDFLAPFFVKICVTNSGTTDQTGGALFLDLPANMIGCFLMGLLTPSPGSPKGDKDDGKKKNHHSRNHQHALPWFHPHHPLQKHKAFHVGLSTGVCGSLTTFASWNTQMIQMLDGTGTVLGPQVVPALCGYVIGLAGPFAFFLLGHEAREWLSSIHYYANKEDKDRENAESDNDDDDNDDNESTTTMIVKWKGDPSWWQWASMGINVWLGPFLFLAGFFAAFLVGAIVYDVQFYQELVVGTAMAPLGALARWKLAAWYNGRDGPWPQRFAWVPWGTLLANLVAAVISASIEAVELQYLSDFTDAWTSELLPAVKVGFAGSLSTVSTLIKEMYLFPNKWNSVVYGTASVTLAMLLGLLVFSPIARHG